MSEAQTSMNTERKWPELGPCRVPAWVYTDPELFDRELEKFHYGKCWNYVGLECELPKPNMYRRNFVGGRPVLMTRDANGDIHVVENRCAHRGSPVCWAQQGEVNDLTCPYHQWTFDMAGNLQGIPFMRGAPRPNPGMPKDFDKSKHGLTKLKTHIHEGTVWASFDQDAPDFNDYVGPEIIRFLDRIFAGRELRLLGYSRQLIPCNWKLYFENSRDPYHATLLHSFFTTFGIYRADARFNVTPQPGGHEYIQSFLDPSLKDTRSDVTAEMKTLKEGFTLEDMSVVTPYDEFKDGIISSLQVFPSLFVQQHGNVLALRHILPKGPQSTELAWTYFGYATDDDEMNSRRLKQGNLVGPAGYVSMEDGEVLAQVQAVVSQNPASEQIVEMGGRDNIGPAQTAITETLIRAFYDFYRREMDLQEEYSLAWTTVAKLDELPEEEGVCVVAEGRKIALFKIADEVFAIDDTCSHADAQLSQGFVEDCAVECPLHQACFDLRTGAPLSAPATEPVNTYPVKVEAGAVLIEL